MRGMQSQYGRGQAGLRCRSGGERGQTTVEAVICLMLLLLILFSLIQVAYLYMGQMIAHHAAFVTARSYVVGFDRRVVRRASEVGTIGLAGHLEQPVAYQNLSPAEQGDVEPSLIAEFLQDNRYTIWYEHWPLVQTDLPMLDMDGMAEVKIRVRQYPLEMPMVGAYMAPGQRTVSFGSKIKMYNHAAYYLEP